LNTVSIENKGLLLVVAITVPEGLSNKFHTNIAKTGTNTPKVRN
jgi:hypothetical protein